MYQFHEYLKIPIPELESSSKVPLTILPDQKSLFIHFANSIANEIRENNLAQKPTRLILPVGPVGGYPYLVEKCNQENISWKNVHTFSMDEYCDWQGRAIPMTHPLSFKGFMINKVFKQLSPEIRIPESQMHFPDPLNLDQISNDIANIGGIDTCYGGVGYHGHVAFNEPPISRWFNISPEELLNSSTRVVDLAPDTIVMNSIRNTGGCSSIFPPKGVTLGMKDIFDAQRIRFYFAGGMWQRNILRISLMGEKSVSYPATLLQSHNDYAIITDEDTAAPINISV